MAKSSAAYEHVDPAAVGNSQRILVSELSGRANIWRSLQKAGLVDEADPSSASVWKDRAAAILTRVKHLEHMGYSFEGAEASVHLMLLHASPGYCTPFRVLDYSVVVADASIDSAHRVVMKHRDRSGPESGGPTSETAQNARATVKVIISGEDAPDLNVAEGTGPVDALFHALTRTLSRVFPTVLDIHLVDYKVRILDPKSATRAATRVECSFKDTATGEAWTTVSVDRNIISASANALVDGLEFGVIEHGELCNLCDFDDDFAAEPATHVDARAPVTSR